MSRYIFDIESSGLLDESTVDYAKSPWQLKDTFIIHCIVALCLETGEIITFVQDACYKEFKPWVEKNVTEIVGFNNINFDMLACKAALDMDYTVGPDTWCGKPVYIDDLFIKSKTLNPDRRGHSVGWFGELLGFEKIDWREKAIELGLIERNAPRGAEFATYHPAMLDYCIRDVQVTCKIDAYLIKEWGDWPWEDAYELEKAVAEIITRQSHRGFWFDSDLAIANVKELDILMEERRAIVEPNLPPKPMGKTKVKEYIPGEKQFKKDGTPNANIIKWCEKHGGVITEENGKYSTELYGIKYVLPIPVEPIVSTEPSNIDDSTFIKGFLVEKGWKPTAYKERDLTVDTKKQKLSYEKFNQAVERYVEQTLESPFCKDRCERARATPATLRQKLLSHDMKKPLKLYTNPTFTVGQEKEIDPALDGMESDFPYVRQIVDYLTYKHRRNSILGGGIDPDDWDAEEEDTTSKGFLANVRSDGRIPTPADTCGAATGRFKHRLVCNVARVTSLYGKNIRAQFGIGDTKRYAQAAFDFASLEGRIEAHYCYKYDNDAKSYCNSLIQEKPNDVHTVTAKVISVLIGQAFPRQSAKSVKYACTYGAQAERVAKTIGCDVKLGQMVYDGFWKAAEPLALLKEHLTAYWKNVGNKSFILGLDKRKIRTRSEHALLNSLFQSAGIICAKRTMVVQERKLKEQGLSIDFWKDDWKNRSYIQQLIVNHDEGQFEVTKDLIKWKLFKDEKDAKQFAEENKNWVGPGHSERGYFMALSPFNYTVKEAVDETNIYYKLNVPLAIDPQYGRNWAECH